MKKITLIIAIVFSGMLMQAQELNENAKLLKNGNEEVQEIYQQIRKFAVNKWDDEHNMVVYEINKQADAVFEFKEATSSSTYDNDIMKKALIKWSEKIDGEFMPDWNMLMYEYKKQLKAKNAY